MFKFDVAKSEFEVRHLKLFYDELLLPVIIDQDLKDIEKIVIVVADVFSFSSYDYNNKK